MAIFDYGFKIELNAKYIYLPFVNVMVKSEMRKESATYYVNESEYGRTQLIIISSTVSLS